MPSEAELVEALKRKDPKALESIITQHGGMMYRTALRIVGQDETEEVLQETFLKVYQKIHTFNGHAALTTWLYRIVLHTALMRLRARSRSREDLLDSMDSQFTEEGAFRHELVDWELSPENTVLRHEALTLLSNTIKDLPETYQEVYVLAEIEGLPHQQIATTLDVSVGVVKTRLHRARLFLRKVLDDYFTERRKKKD
ncbi:MAG: sigma-70 family RNA polymerase sigma factor [Deltaproteobacteria bacterium]|nr:sigma-70 family RNA polymerase sigma factor [Deltaproteobacteria bacterium]